MQLNECQISRVANSHLVTDLCGPLSGHGDAYKCVLAVCVTCYIWSLVLATILQRMHDIQRLAK